ncbi:MAG: hypothetical protein M1817_002130 [Caeruleum heppii]|nr:MAG: hypothetical protein M1817_002130 [Caeruleum heppii]
MAVIGTSSSLRPALRSHLRWRACPTPSPVRSLHANNSFFSISEEVREALHTKKPVVALETTIYTHGFPYPENVGLASHLESAVRVNGGIPATIGVLDGVARVGMSAEELISLTASAGKVTTMKLSRRDLGYICGLGHTGKKLHGGTTIAATMLLAHLAGIKVFATGGLGGVHRDGENSLDISADLTEMGRTPVAVISSGCKSFLDIGRTLEYLETEGVPVATFADGRDGNIDFPAFWSRDSGFRSPLVVTNEEEAAAMIYAQSLLPVPSGLLFANPIPSSHAIPKPQMDAFIKQALQSAHQHGIAGHANTPFVLNEIRKLTHGKSVVANMALAESNVVRGTKIAVALQRMELSEAGIKGGNEGTVSVSTSAVTKFSSGPGLAGPHGTAQKHPTTVEPTTPPPTPSAETAAPVEVLVAGSLAVDFSCNYRPTRSSPSPSTADTPQLRTSNPAIITQHVGGVGFNLMRAMNHLGVSTRLCTATVDDACGAAALKGLRHAGISDEGIIELSPSSGNRTAQYVAVNDTKRDLVLAMADMSLLGNVSEEAFEIWKQDVKDAQADWVVVDANWSPSGISRWIVNAREAGSRVAFEPVSVEKSRRLFSEGTTDRPRQPLPVFPNHVIDLATPNQYELQAMFEAVQETEQSQRQDWWDCIDALGISSAGARVQLSVLTDSGLVDRGIPQQSLQLLPFIPCLITKLGAEGVLLSQLLGAEDPRLSDPAMAPYILSRSKIEDSPVGGVYMRLFPAVEKVPTDEVVSVNGVGDTFLGVLLAGLVKRQQKKTPGTGRAVGGVEGLMDVAQRGSVMTLKSAEAVSPLLGQLREDLEG